MAFQGPELEGNDSGEGKEFFRNPIGLAARSGLR